MKIYYVANARIPTEKAHGIQLAKMCEAFLLEGVDLELILPKRGHGGSLKEFYGLKVEIPVKRLPVLNLGFILSSLSFMFSYFMHLRGKKNALIYTIDMDNFSFVFLRFLGFPYFAEIYDAKKKTLFWRFFFKKINGVATIGNQIKKILIENFKLDGKKIIVTPNGIDLEMFSEKISKEEARAKLNLPLDKKIALYTGHQTWWKGTEILKEAQKFLPPETICIIENRPYREIPLWIRVADLCLVLGTKKHEYSYFHTSPMKLFEYMASGRPILAADTPANREIVTEKEAVFYQPDNPKDLALKIKTMLTKSENYELQIKASLAKAREYTWSNRAKKILEFMETNK